MCIRDSTKGEYYEPRIPNAKRRLDLRFHIIICDKKCGDENIIAQIDLWIEIEKGLGKTGIEQIKTAAKKLQQNINDRNTKLWLELWADSPSPPEEFEDIREEIKKMNPSIEINYRCIPILMEKYRLKLMKMQYTCEKVRYAR